MMKLFEVSFDSLTLEHFSTSRSDDSKQRHNLSKTLSHLVCYWNEVFSYHNKNEKHFGIK